MTVELLSYYKKTMQRHHDVYVILYEEMGQKQDFDEDSAGNTFYPSEIYVNYKIAKAREKKGEVCCLDESPFAGEIRNNLKNRQ